MLEKRRGPYLIQNRLFLNKTFRFFSDESSFLDFILLGNILVGYFGINILKQKAELTKMASLALVLPIKKLV